MLDINYGIQPGFEPWFEQFIDLFDDYFAVIYITDDVEVEVIKMDF